MKSFNSAKTIMPMALVTMLLIAGCALNPSGPGDASADVRHAVSAYEDQHDYHRAVAGLERALDTYQGTSFTQSTLTALALIQLDYGNREAFLETADRLELIIGRRDYIPQQTQHVLAVAFAMRGRPQVDLPGRGYDYAYVRSVYSLLGAGS